MATQNAHYPTNDVAEKVLRRAEIAKVARNLQDRLALANFKAQNGWQNRPLRAIEPEVTEQLRRKRPYSSGDVLSDDSSYTSEEYHYYNSSPLTAPTFSDDMPGSYHTRSSPLKGPPFKAIQNFSTRKKIRSSSNTASAKASTGNKSWRHGHRVAQSSPVFQRPALPLSHLHPSFVSDTTTIPELRHRDRSFKFTSHLSSHDDKDELPVHSFASPSLIPSSPPRTPSPTPQPRNRKIKPNSKESGADLLLYLANSPSRSPALSQQTRRIGGNVSIALEPPSTPPFQHTNKDLPSSFLSTPTTSSHHNSINLPLFSTPGQQFNFADFVNVTPSPAQAPWGGRTPGTINNRTIPARTGAARRGLNFDALVPPPTTSTNTGLKTPTTLTSGKGLALELEMEMDLGAKLVPIS